MPSRPVLLGVSSAFFLAAIIATGWLQGAPLMLAHYTLIIAYTIYLGCVITIDLPYEKQNERPPRKVAGQMVLLACLPWLVLISPIGKFALPEVLPPEKFPNVLIMTVFLVAVRALPILLQRAR